MGSSLGLASLGSVTLKQSLDTCLCAASRLRQMGQARSFPRPFPALGFYETRSPLKNKQQKMSDKQFKVQPRLNKSQQLLKLYGPCARRQTRSSQPKCWKKGIL